MGKKNQKNRINIEISQFGKVKSVRLVGENVDNGIYDLNYAIKLAEDQGVDLVEINSQSTPICRIVDYNKFLYEQNKKAKDNAKNQKKQEVKELRFTPNTDDHDFNFKRNNAESFLKKGDKVKAVVFFKGREITFKEKGELMLLKFADELKEIAIPERLPILEGMKMIMILKPKMGKK
jgi:translation initiation factor IF-3